MGQQQLLLIVLGVIIVGIAVVVGIIVFRAAAIDQKRELLIEEVSGLVPFAQKYYHTPSAMGGSGNGFIGWDVPKDMRNSSNGSIKMINAEADQIELEATGNEVVVGADSIKVRLIIYPRNFKVEIVN